MVNQGSSGRPPGGGNRPPTGQVRRAPGGAYGVLQCIGGNDRGKQHQLINPQTTLGRGADQDFILADISVSRKHVVIVMQGDRYRVRDLGSGNGTLVNGVRADDAVLNDGDRIEIGNTVLRFDHAPSRAQAAQNLVPQAPPGAATLLGDAPPYQPPVQAAPTGFPPVSQPIADPFSVPPAEATPLPPNRPPAAQLPTPLLTGPQQRLPSGGLLDSTGKKVAVFGAIGLVVLLGAAVVVKKVAFSGGGKAEAEQLYLEGTKTFGAGDYEKAKELFTGALRLVPDSPQTEKYLKQCDVEIHARGALKKAQNHAKAKEWEDELKALDSIDKSSASFEEAEKLRKQAVPQAVAAYLDEAKAALADDPDTARAKLEAALLLDPESSDAKALEEQLKTAKPAGRPAARAEKEPPPAKPARPAVATREPREPPAPRPAREPAPTRSPPARPTRPAVVDDDDDDEDGGGGGGAGDLVSNRAAMGPYRAKDFNGAATAIRLQARTQKGADAQKSIALAAQIGQLASAYNRAEEAKSGNAAAALLDYQKAAQIDAQIAKGTHGAYFKAQISKLAGQGAQQAFAAQKFDQAYELVKAAQKAGVSDGGVGAQLRAKAAELHARASGMARSNPNGAKNIWRMVLKMVPPTDPSYVKATQGLSAASGAAKADEDED